MDPRIGSLATTFVDSVSPLRDAVGFLAMLLVKQNRSGSWLHT